jgi:Na+/H+ antiporter NhaD/arsenite permease-like protein
MLIGQVLELRFAAYLAVAAVPVVLGLVATWFLIAWQSGGRWHAALPASASDRREDEPALDRWQTAKGLTVVAVLLAIFVATEWPREVAALIAAGVLLTSRKFHSTKMLGLVDWELLILFIGLFVVNHALERTGATQRVFQELAASGMSMREPGMLFGATFLLSNLVSNVPAVMLLLPAATEPFAGPMLALVSTLAGNLLIVGSIANMIVVAAAARQGIQVDWKRHGRSGIPVTVATLAIVAAWFALRS